MIHLLVYFHAIMGFAGSIAPLWIILKIREPVDRIPLAAIRAVAFISLILIVAAWISGGAYYIEVYSSTVKPGIISIRPWAHFVVMESKEHVFLFLPYLAALLNVLVWNDIERSNRQVKAVALSIGILGLVQTLFGFTISCSKEVTEVIL